MGFFQNTETALEASQPSPPCPAPTGGWALLPDGHLLSLCSRHYPLYSLNVASMWLKLGRLYLGLENRVAGERALRKVRIGLQGQGVGSWACA